MGTVQKCTQENADKIRALIAQDEKASLRALASKMGMTISTVKNIIDTFRIPYISKKIEYVRLEDTPENCERIVRAIEKKPNITLEELAQEFGTSASFMVRFLRKNHISRKQKKSKEVVLDPKNPLFEIIVMNTKARAAGMTYGEFVAQEEFPIFVFDKSKIKIKVEKNGTEKTAEA